MPEGARVSPETLADSGLSGRSAAFDPWPWRASGSNARSPF